MRTALTAERRSRYRLMKRAVFLLMLGSLAAVASAAEPPALSILYPKPNAVVGNKVNVVLDPALDWSALPFFQVVVNGTVSEVVDTSTGRHAKQGLDLRPGLNTITIKVLAAADGGTRNEIGKEGKKEFTEIVVRQISVFSRVELFTGRTAPEGYMPGLFHARENEAACSGCHQLETTSSAAPPKKPEEAICYPCHRSIPTGKNIHGPAAVWHCLSCHDPDVFPVKYQFADGAPRKLPAASGLTIRDTCLKCHRAVMSGPFKHGPVDAGYCTLCHDPHASENAAWLRKPSWDLCTTCHVEKATGLHVLTGFKNNASHPTRRKRDPARRGKRMTCVSCHAPHSAAGHDLFAFGAKDRSELCIFCHEKKI